MFPNTLKSIIHDSDSSLNKISFTEENALKLAKTQKMFFHFSCIIRTWMDFWEEQINKLIIPYLQEIDKELLVSSTDNAPKSVCEKI